MAKVSHLRWVGVVAFIVLVSVVSFALLFGKGVNAQTSSMCTDTDDGKNYFVKGTMTETGKAPVMDRCRTEAGATNVLVEGYCENNKGWAYDKTCPNGCKDGVCVKEFGNCTNTDGGIDYFVKGDFAYDTYNSRGAIDGHAGGTESCNDANVLQESYCKDGVPQTLRYTCPRGCKNGACIKAPEEIKCTDSDNGQTYDVKGTVSFKNPSNGSRAEESDFCLPADGEKIGYVAEYYCSPYDSSGAIRRDYKCPNGCEDGACMAEPSAEEEGGEEDIGGEEEEEVIEDRAEQIKQIQELITGIGGMDSVLRGVNVMEKTFKTLASQGIAMPSDLAETIARAKELNPEIIKFKNAKAENVTDEDAGTLTDNMNEMCGISSTLEELGDQIPRVLQLGAKIKQASKDLKKAKSDVTRAAKIAVRSKFDIADKADELNGAVEALKTTLDDVNASTDFDDKDYKIGEFYNQFRDIYDTIGVINALQNTARAKVEWARRVKANASTISKLSKNADLDVSELTSKNDEVKAKLDELGAALAKKPVDRDEIKWIFENLKGLNTEFVYIADQLGGTNSALPKVKVAKFDTSQFKKTGAFSQFCEPLN